MLETAQIYGRHGVAEGLAGVTAEVIEGLSIASVAERRHGAAGLAELMAINYGLTLPRRPAHVGAGALGAVAVGPGRWLVLGAPPDLGRSLHGVASVTEQSDGFVPVTLSGPSVLKCLAKGVPLDLHAAAFPPGSAATTIVAHIGVTLWCLDATPRFALLIARSYWVSFMAWLIASGAEFGIEVVPAKGRG
ncbi:sarcosine oxidase, gamma subunit [Oleomonas cavernae]|uniref:Sarcosine oxidase, gamma subunit n=1 Tax=Oleomonas cavernae TaxID=2320859 RepID=A0A418WTZ8_9PROT|nr:sarcosine oxidase subunit gamma family protein [Oleomonas cavernae]RJF94705.1 sarcosine oxidase, gamma subunit [Oleomonas cavernae]